MNHLHPISSTQRLDLVDALRGFAILGILMVNMPAMFTPGVEVIMMPSLGEAGLDRLAHIFIIFFFAGKFFVLFSLLFGFGFYIFLHKDGAPGPQAVKTFRKRLFWLLIFGILHVTLLWEGDILIFYALFGFLLILFRKSSIKKITIWLIIFLLIPIVFIGLISLLPIILASNPEALAGFEQGNQQQLAQTKDIIQRAYETYSAGTFGEMMAMNWEQWIFLIAGIFIFYPTCMAMFLLGLIVGKKELFKNAGAYLPLYRKLFWMGLIIGTPLNILLLFVVTQASPGTIDYWMVLGRTAGIFGGVAFLFAYVSGFILLYHSGKFSRLFSGLSAVGRMALTNYLSHSLIALFLFRSVGFGLYGKVEVWQGILLTFFIFGLQIIFSKWWLGKFRFGPLEWLWRTLTYGQAQPFKRSVIS
jgi:uncharacterized protein